MSRNIQNTLTLPGTPGLPEIAHGSLRFIGTATVLLRYAGFTILTDPNFLHQGEYANLGYGLHSRRLTNPALPLERVPPLDLIILSHMHGDHFDHVVMHRLDKAIPIVTTQQATRVLRHNGFAATQPLKPWQALTIVKGQTQLRITALPALHAHGLIGHVLPPVMGSMLEFMHTNGHMLLRIYISGDTLMDDQLKAIPYRYPEIDLGLLHLGGTRILGMLVSMDAQQGLEMLELINPRLVIPIHYNDYTAFKSPLHDFQQLISIAGLEERVIYLRHGETYTFELTHSRITGER